MAIRAVIYDLDGVVVHSEPVHDKALYEVLLRKVPVIPDSVRKEIKLATAGRRAMEGFAFVKEYFGLKESVEDLREQIRGEFYKIFEDEMNLMPGFEESVKRVRRKYRTALTTSATGRYLRRLEEKFEISQYFEFMLNGDHVENSKPHPEPYIVTCRGLKIMPHEGAVVEDARAGIDSAKGAGCVCIGMPTTFPASELKRADYIAINFKEVEKILEGMA